MEFGSEQPTLDKLTSAAVFVGVNTKSTFFVSLQVFLENEIIPVPMFAKPRFTHLVVFCDYGRNMVHLILVVRVTLTIKRVRKLIAVARVWTNR